MYNLIYDSESFNTSDVLHFKKKQAIFNTGLIF